MFGESDVRPFTAQDIRFTTRRGALYALVLAWPDTNTVTIKSLATGVQGQVRRVELLGTGQALRHLRNDQGLTITLPQHKIGDHAHALKISGDGLV
jgi:alpha-L-fucosidase